MSHKCCSNIIIPTRAKFDSYSAISQGQDECLNDNAPLTASALRSMLRYGWQDKAAPYLFAHVQNTSMSAVVKIIIRPAGQLKITGFIMDTMNLTICICSLCRD